MKRIFGAVVAVALLAAVFVATGDASASQAVGVDLVGLAGLALGQKLMMPQNIASYDFATLQDRARPGRGGANIAEANVDVLYDTQTALAAGVTQLNFFTNVNADQTLSNMELAGTLPADTFFDVWRIFVDANRVLTATVADTAAGVMNDIALLLHSARATLTFSMFNKPVGPVPLTFFGNSGRPEGYLGTGRAAAAGAVIQAGAMPDNGGWPANGTIRIPPQTKFGVQLNIASGAAVTLSADTPLRVTLLGVKYRRNA